MPYKNGKVDMAGYGKPKESNDDKKNKLARKMMEMRK